MPRGQKHLITCRCFLPQFKHAKELQLHKFIVFSVINDDDTVVPKNAQCPNCAMVHKVTDICRSVVLGKDETRSVVSIDDIKVSLPEKLVGILENNGADLPTWEAVQFNHENKQWGSFVVLSTDTIDGEKTGKVLKILGENLFKVEAFSRSMGNI
jgi:hypothetical protein